MRYKLKEKSTVQPERTVGNDAIKQDAKQEENTGPASKKLAGARVSHTAHGLSAGRTTDGISPGT